MKATIHKLLTGASLVVLTVFGLTALSSSSTDSADNTQAWAFLNTTCSSDIAVLLDNTEYMLELRGQERHGIILDFKSYYRVAELHWAEPPCHLVSVLLVEAPVITKRSPLPRIPAPPPPPQVPANPQEPKPKPQNPPPTDDFNQATADKLKECWEKKAKELKNQEKINGHSPKVLVETSLSSRAEWGIDNKMKEGIAYMAPPSIQKEKLFMKIDLLPKGIRSKIALRPDLNFEFNHFVTYAQMQESYHIAQFVKVFNETEALPEPYEYWQMEVDSHAGANKLWLAIYGPSAGPPSFLKLDSDENKARREDYQKKQQEYLDLKKKEKDGTITKSETSDLKTLAEELTAPAYLPQAQGNEFYKPHEIDLDCNLEEDED